jgi:chorismate synthase
MSNSFGRIFRITSFGESHGKGIGVVIDGCPAGLPIDLDSIQQALNKRRPGQSDISTQRKENDLLQSLSGLEMGISTGAPLAFFVANEDARPQDYENLKQVFRPSHADYTWTEKYGIRSAEGGGRASARETIARVIGGEVARQLLNRETGIQIFSWVSGVGEVQMKGMPTAFQFADGNSSKVKCPDSLIANEMVKAIEQAKAEGDSLGGVISCIATKMPVGLGEPLYDKLHARLGYAMLGINAVKGFEIGSGFEGATLKGSEQNDAFFEEDGKVKTRTNHSGGIQGGISNGADVFFRVAFKPTSTIRKSQETVNVNHESVTLEAKGRHDPCVVPRAVPIVEALTALVLADFWLLNRNSKF